MDDPYVVAGVSLRQFVADWLVDLEANAEPSNPLIREAMSGPPRERYWAGADYAMAQIAPRATDEACSQEVLLLFAVLSVYHAADFPGADLAVWDGFGEHVGRAFAYLHSIGEPDAANRLREKVVQRSDPARRSGIVHELTERSLGHDPGRIAAHERDMARFSHRELRAANALDPDGELTLDMF